MRLRNVPGAKEIVWQSPLVIKDLSEAKGNWKNIFGNDAELDLEIGIGKGRFITTLALENPNINYVGIERYESVLYRAVNKATEENINNLRFLCMDASLIETAFGEGEVGRIYLNFSDPWPKERHAKRRLCSENFLEKYANILIEGSRVELKTDNLGLFEFGLSQAAQCGWKTDYFTYDLHNDEKLMAGNVMTEYEEKFSSKGAPIYKFCIFQEK